MENLQLDQEAIVVADCPTAFKKKTRKTIQRRKVPNTNLWKVEFYSGGQLPKCLKKYWTDILELERDVQKYIEFLEDKKLRKEKWRRKSRYFNWEDGKPWQKRRKSKTVSTS